MSRKSGKTAGKIVGVAAIDLGTTYSGYAYCYNDETSDIVLCQWGRHEMAAMSSKAPTAILFTPQSSFHSFGFVSEEKYASLMEKDEHKNWFFFRNFKLRLKDIDPSIKPWKLKDETGKEMEASVIFKHAIQYLCDHLMDNLRKRQSDITKKDITWVVTVPAIWSDAAKKFMREVSVEVGIPDKNLVLAYEPEAAAIHCIMSKEPISMPGSKSLENMSQGTKFMLVDMGGGTIDVSAQEVLPNGRMKLLHYPEGDLKGGMTINSNFEERLKKDFGEDNYKKFQEEQPQKNLKLQRDIERIKRFTDLGDADDIRIHLPKALRSFRKNTLWNEGQTTDDEKEGEPESMRQAQALTKDDSYLRLSKADYEGLFDDSKSCISATIDRIQKNDNCKDIKTMVVIGGFAESAIILDFLRKEYPTMHITVPLKPDLAILRGALRIGRIPDIITTRVCRKTYGFSVFKDFIPNTHLIEKKVTRNNKEMCKDCFFEVFTINESVKIGEVRRIPVRDEFTPDREEKRRDPLTVKIYSSSKESVIYTTDEGCVHLTTITIPPPESGWRRQVNGVVEFEVAGTELVGKFHDEFKDYTKQDVRFDFVV